MKWLERGDGTVAWVSRASVPGHEILCEWRYRRPQQVSVVCTCGELAHHNEADSHVDVAIEMAEVIGLHLWTVPE